ncbi:FAD-binding oxidoreductase [Actinomadura oligospora]|uniref:FAD-binding oxidoreductase n=1 Tax=Actinomadura oligospora TaxID=111804 RepID=UPI00047BD98F|nr:FAD-binding oxidoreductase [Actinomadura oligospora]
MNRFDPQRSTALAPSEVEALAGRVSGPVVTPGGEQYDAERAGYQIVRSHRPDLIVGAVGAADVRTAVEFATDHGLPVAVQGTGHALSGIAAEGGVLVNTTRMSGVRVNPETGEAWVAAGTPWSRVVHEAAPAGLAPLSGSLPSLGAVAYTLGGGLGLLSRRYGYAADHVRGLDVVTADGRLRNVTANSDPDLFWALRGGRDNFGIVTGMEIGLLPVTALYGGGMFFDGANAIGVFETWIQWTTTVPDEMSSSIALISFPDVPALPEPLRGRHIVHVRFAYTADDLSGGEPLVAPLRALDPIIDTLNELPYTQAGTIYNDPPVPGAFEGDTAMMGPLDAGAVRAILDHAGPHAPVPHIVELRHLGGRIAAPPPVGNAVGHRDASYLFNISSRLERADIDEIRPAHDRLLKAIAPWTTGGRALNFMNGENAGTVVDTAYEATTLRRLTRLKSIYDPQNTFRHNHNIRPAE